jgi:pyruvate,water dikinase
MNESATIIRSHEPHPVSRVGGKAHALAELSQAGLNIPEWFVVTPNARHEDGSIRPEARAAIKNAARELGADRQFAVRSSSIEEDHADHSFAGQFESYLAVPIDRIIDRVQEVWASALSDRVRAYRREQGMEGEPSMPAVLVQRMLEPESAGVAFAADPISGRRAIAVVAAVRGLGTSLVDGEADGDTFHVDLAERIIHRRIVDKPHTHRADPTTHKGVSAVATDRSDVQEPALSDEQVRQVVRLARTVSRLLHRPQDIEWAIAEGRVHLLQSRPITNLGQLPDPDAPMTVWDNANIIESYPGITLPLTYSFARRAYEHVYRQFSFMMGVPRRRIEANDQLFANMIGLIRGRVYYNLVHWYRLLSLLPGYRSNRGFMEQMMGVRESLPDEAMPMPEAAGVGARWVDRASMAVPLLRLLGHHLRMNRNVAAFYTRLDRALGDGPSALADMRSDQLASEYHRLERQLLSRWDAPLINDFYAMIFHGLLRRLSARYLSDASLHNQLLCDQGEVISAEPARLIQAMAEKLIRDTPLIDRLCHGDRADAERAIAEKPDVQTMYRSYLDRFGERCMEELKLETLTLADDPTPLLRSIGHTARRLQSGGGGTDRDSAAARGRQKAEQQLVVALKGHPLRRLIYRWVLHHARTRVTDRENLRFERTRIFGRVRRIYVELGHRLVADGHLDAARDVFYLEHDEVLRFIEGTSTCTDLRAMVAVRRATYQAWREADAPPERFVTRGCVSGALIEAAESSAMDQAETRQTLQGTGCCAGRVVGMARVVIDPTGARIHENEILVAPRTDPGWILLFPAAAGVLVERGSLLSHSAIVARELGIPAVVAVEGLLQNVRTGDRLEMDGSTGTIRLLKGEADAQ